MNRPTDKEKATERASYKWPKASPRGLGNMVICPDCGVKGHPGLKWTWAHCQHTKAPCGRKYVTGRYLQHRVHCDTCRALPRD